MKLCEWCSNMSNTTTLIWSAILIYGPHVSFSSPYRTVTRHKEGEVAERKRRYTYYIFLVLKECDSGKCFTNSTHFLTNRYGPQFLFTDRYSAGILDNPPKKMRSNANRVHWNKVNCLQTLQAYQMLLGCTICKRNSCRI